MSRPMIRLLDEIVVDTDQLPALRQLMAAHYLPGAQARGMVLAGEWVSPPVAVPGEPNVLWLLWQLADVAGWWQMRFRSGTDAAVADLWCEVDRICRSRRRHTLAPAAEPLAQPAENEHAA